MLNKELSPEQVVTRKNKQDELEQEFISAYNAPKEKIKEKIVKANPSKRIVIDFEEDLSDPIDQLFD